MASWKLASNRSAASWWRERYSTVCRINSPAAGVATCRHYNQNSGNDELLKATRRRSAVSQRNLLLNCHCVFYYYSPWLWRGFWKIEEAFRRTVNVSELHPDVLEYYVGGNLLKIPRINTVDYYVPIAAYSRADAETRLSVCILPGWVGAENSRPENGRPENDRPDSVTWKYRTWRWRTRQRVLLKRILKRVLA